MSKVVSPLLLLTIALLTFAACGDDDDDTSSTATVTASPSQPSEPTGTLSASPTTLSPSASQVAGAPVQILRVQDPVVLSATTAYYIGSGCWGCEGYTTGLQRWVTDAQGNATKTDLLTFPKRDGEVVTGVHGSNDASRFVATTCLAKNCGPLGQYTAPASSRIWVSLDGGVAWTLLGSEEQGVTLVLAVSPEAVLLSRTHGDFNNAANWVEEYFILGQTTPLARPPGARPGQPPVLLPGPSAGWMSDSATLLDSSGGTLIRFSLDPGDEVQPNGVFTTTPSSSDWLVTWFRQGPNSAQFIGVFDKVGKATLVYKAEKLFFPTGWPEGRSAIGFVDFARPAGARGVGPLPAFLELRGGIVTPLGGPFLDQNGRNHLLAAVPGAFVTVSGAGPGSCVYVRAEPKLAGAVQGCYADGVLLRTSGPEAEADGKTWLSVVAPDRKSGFVSADYVAR